MFKDLIDTVIQAIVWFLVVLSIMFIVAHAVRMSKTLWL